MNAINPSKTATARMAEGVETEARQRKIPAEAVHAKVTERLPLGRPATPGNVASAVVFLASPQAGYISGSILSMDGAARPMVV